jgi:GDSL-like lipase/acylhydrolase family protein/SGNH-like hydrolase/esterase family protein
MKSVKVIIFLIIISISCTLLYSSDKVYSSEKVPLTLKFMKFEDSDLLWYDAKDLLIEGKGWTDTENFYNRLPVKVKDKVTKAVWNLNDNTAGICVRFISNSKKIGASWDGGTAMRHMAATGNSGLDLYERKDGNWIFSAVGKPSPKRTTKTFLKNQPGSDIEYLLYLPLYNSVSDLKIGIEEGAKIISAEKRPESEKPIVFYGTSITQGGCASRCGMCHTALIGRWQNREVINLGFSGAGKMEPVMAELLAELDASLYILECLPNMTLDMVKNRVEPFIRILRKIKPNTPVLLVESPFKSAAAANISLEKTYNKLKKEGVKNIHYLKGDKLLKGKENGTVDGVHPTDLGFFRIAKVMNPVITGIIEK